MSLAASMLTTPVARANSPVEAGYTPRLSRRHPGPRWKPQAQKNPHSAGFLYQPGHPRKSFWWSRGLSNCFLMFLKFIFFI